MLPRWPRNLSLNCPKAKNQQATSAALALTPTLTGSLPVGQEWPAQGGQRNKICSTPFEHVMIVLQPGITVGVTGGHVGSEMGVQFSRGSDSSKIGVIENHTSKHPSPMIFMPKWDPKKVVNYHYRDVG